MRISSGRVRSGGIAICLGFLMAGAAACAVRAAGDGPATDAGLAEPVRSGCQGGITGGGNGVTIDANDHVVTWSKSTAGAPEELVDTGADPAVAAEVRRQLDAIAFTAIDFNEPGNMTCFVAYRGHTVAWPIGDARAPAAVVAIHDRLSGLR